MIKILDYMKYFVILIIPVLNCCSDNPSPTKNVVSEKKDTVLMTQNKYCYFFEAQLYRNYKLTISSDTLSVYHQNSVLDKTWFDDKYNEIRTEEYKPDPGNASDIKSGNKTLILILKNGPPKIEYVTMPDDIKKKIKKMGFDINYAKIQKSNDSYFFLENHDDRPYPFILSFNVQNEKIDTIIWSGHITINMIDDFMLYDFKNDGYVDLFVFSEDLNHEGSYAVTGITTSPIWRCSGKHKSRNEPGVR